MWLTGTTNTCLNKDGRRRRRGGNSTPSHVSNATGKFSFYSAPIWRSRSRVWVPEEAEQAVPCRKIVPVGEGGGVYSRRPSRVAYCT